MSKELLAHGWDWQIYRESGRLFWHKGEAPRIDLNEAPWVLALIDLADSAIADLADVGSGTFESDAAARHKALRKYRYYRGEEAQL